MNNIQAITAVELPLDKIPVSSLYNENLMFREIIWTLDKFS
jgi:hypothetical protein